MAAPLLMRFSVNVTSQSHLRNNLAGNVQLEDCAPRLDLSDEAAGSQEPGLLHKGGSRSPPPGLNEDVDYGRLGN